MLSECKWCRSKDLRVEELNGKPHWGKLMCNGCDRHLQWLSKKALELHKKPLAK